MNGWRMQVEHHLFCVYVKDKTVKVFVRLYKTNDVQLASFTHSNTKLPGSIQ